MFQPNPKAYKWFPPQFRAAFTWEVPEEVTGKTWFSLRNQDDGSAEVFINDFIGLFGVESKDFVHAIAPLKGQLSVRLNSPGGDIFQGVEIFNALKRHDGPVHIHVDGIAASAASLIAMAGDSIIMHPGTMLMIHEAWGIAIGNASDMEAMAVTLDKVSADMAGIYAARTTTGKRAVRQMMKDETWMTGKEAVEHGFADQAVSPSESTAQAKAQDSLPGHANSFNESLERQSHDHQEPMQAEVTTITESMKGKRRRQLALAERGERVA